MDLQSYIMIISPPKYGIRPESISQPIAHGSAVIFHDHLPTKVWDPTGLKLTTHRRMDLQSYIIIISTKVWDPIGIKLTTHRRMDLQSYIMIISTKVWDPTGIELATHRRMDLQSDLFQTAMGLCSDKITIR